MNEWSGLSGWDSHEASKRAPPSMGSNINMFKLEAQSAALRTRPSGWWSGIPILTFWRPSCRSEKGGHLPAEKVVHLVLSTVLKAYKVMHRRRTAAGPANLHSSGAALMHGTLASKESCNGGVPQPVRAGAPDLHSSGTEPCMNFISLQNGAQIELHHFLCLQK